MIVIGQRKTATLDLNFNGEDLKIAYPVNSMAGYRKATDMLKRYREITKAKEIIKGDVTEDQSVEILDQSVSLMEGFREAVRVAIGEEQYNKIFKTDEDWVPFTAWVQILSEVVKGYADYFKEVAGTEGEL